MAKPTPESEPTRIEGSFRDPAGQIFQKDGHIYRTVNAPAAEDFAFVQNTDFYSKAIVEKRLIAADPVPLHVLNGQRSEASCVIEHPRLPFVSYPYEWTFGMLKTAAQFHLDFQIDALADGITLVDASAYNVQFIGASPIFIDTLSLRRYEPGALWTGYKQFCDQFLNPLLLHSYVGLHHNAWYRGSQEGITAGEIRKLLPARRKLSRRVLTHVTLQDSLQKTTRKGSGPNLETLRAAGLPLPVFRKTLANLRDWIAGLEPKNAGPTEWSDYAKANSYAPQEEALKQEFVADFVRREKPRQVWDLGCNSGEYAAVCLEAGADYVVGFDSDHGALDLAFSRAREEQLRFLPLFLDIANPPPSQGWAQRERYGLQERAGADGVIALALIHHMSIGRNVPLAEAVAWLVGLAPRGVIEFVPRNDPMVQELLRFREDIFPKYTEENFLQELQALASIERRQTSSSTGRLLVEFLRHPRD